MHVLADHAPLGGAVLPDQLHQLGVLLRAPEDLLLLVVALDWLLLLLLGFDFGAHLKDFTNTLLVERVVVGGTLRDTLE